MILQIDFPIGAYSSNKDDIKKVFSLLDYKYKSGIPSVDNKLICIWQRQNDNKKIKGVFNGSGMACQFIVECNEDERKIFESFQTSFKARVSIHNANPQDTTRFMEEAKRRVMKWFTYVPQHKDEPTLFYKYRLEKQEQSKEWFIQQEYNRLLNAN